MNDIAVCVSNANKNVSVFETIDTIKKTGFKKVFIQWYNRKWDISQEEQLNYIKNCGLQVIFAHLGYDNINNLWFDNELGDELIEFYKKDIKICKENNINLVVMHLCEDRNKPDYSKTGIKRLKELVEYAKIMNVRIAFENTKVSEFLEYVLHDIKDENVGVCFDSGHNHVYVDKFNIDLFKDRIFAIHLHDNNKTKDQHLIPYDGNINWDIVLENLKKCNYNGDITLELCYRNEYLKMSVEEFYKKGYEVGKKLYDSFYK